MNVVKSRVATAADVEAFRASERARYRAYRESADSEGDEPPLCTCGGDMVRVRVGCRLLWAFCSHDCKQKAIAQATPVVFAMLTYYARERARKTRNQ